jgi:hypothetical protein
LLFHLREEERQLMFHLHSYLQAGAMLVSQCVGSRPGITLSLIPDVTTLDTTGNTARDSITNLES